MEYQWTEYKMNQRIASMKGALNHSIVEIRKNIIEIEENIRKIEYYEIEEIINLLIMDSRKGVQLLGSRLKRAKENLYNEINRVKKMYSFDKSFGEYKIVAGVDEVGRGPLAGPIVAVAVVMELDYKDEKELILRINDSKKVKDELRKELAEIIKEKAISYSIAVKSNKDIDEKGIAYCNHMVFLEAIENLGVKCDLVLSDGYKAKYYHGNNEAVIKGDTKSFNIACASIIAKVYRDEIMKEEHKKYPQYGFCKNMGYGTEEHIKSIKKYGITDIHRESFLNSII